MNVMDLMRERVQDIRNIQNSQMGAKQIKYREKIRQMIELDSMNQLQQAKKLNQNDLLQFQEVIRFIVKIIAPNFEIVSLEPNLASTAKMMIELYQYYGLQTKSEQLINELYNQTKQGIFINLLQHLIDITRMALEFTIKRQTDMRLYCVGKEIDKRISLSNPPKRILVNNVQRSESNKLNQERAFQSKQSIHEAPLETQSPNESPAKTQRMIEETTYRDNSVPKCHQVRQSEGNSKKTLPSIYQPRNNQHYLLQQLKRRNLNVQNTIQAYLKSLQDKMND